MPATRKLPDIKHVLVHPARFENVNCFVIHLLFVAVETSTARHNTAAARPTCLLLVTISFSYDFHPTYPVSGPLTGTTFRRRPLLSRPYHKMLYDLVSEMPPKALLPGKADTTKLLVLPILISAALAAPTAAANVTATTHRGPNAPLVGSIDSHSSRQVLTPYVQGIELVVSLILQEKVQPRSLCTRIDS